MEIKNFLSVATQKLPKIEGIHWFYLRVKSFQLRNQKLIFGGGLVFLGFLFLTGGYIFNKIEKAVKTMPRFSIPFQKLAIQNLPSWLSPFTPQISPIHFSIPTPTIFSPTLSKEIAFAYLRNPWVERIEKIVLEYPNHVYIKFLLRRPIAWIHLSPYYFLTDLSGIRLPGKYLQIPNGTESLPIIQGVEEIIPLEGHRWSSDSLQQALLVIEYLARYQIEKSLPITHILLKNRKNIKHKEIILVGRPNIQIRWGDSLHSLFPPVSASQRLQALQEFLRLCKLDKIQLMKKVYLDVRLGSCIILPGVSNER